MTTVYLGITRVTVTDCVIITVTGTAESSIVSISIRRSSDVRGINIRNVAVVDDRMIVA